MMMILACALHFHFPLWSTSYPFVDGQAIPLGWDGVLEELAAEILEDPSPKRFAGVKQNLAMNVFIVLPHLSLVVNMLSLCFKYHQHFTLWVAAALISHRWFIYFTNTGKMILNCAITFTALFANASKYYTGYFWYEASSKNFWLNPCLPNLFSRYELFRFNLKDATTI